MKMKKILWTKEQKFLFLTNNTEIRASEKLVVLTNLNNTNPPTLSWKYANRNTGIFYSWAHTSLKIGSTPSCDDVNLFF